MYFDDIIERCSNSYANDKIPINISISFVDNNLFANRKELIRLIIKNEGYEINGKFNKASYSQIKYNKHQIFSFNSLSKPHINLLIVNGKFKRKIKDNKKKRKTRR